MNEISVTVMQEPGKVSWNFEEIKSKLEASLREYLNMQYDDSSIKTAKSDAADLRALARDINGRCKEIKEKCLEPYNVINDQAKELVALIDKPINAINEQVQDYERRRKERVRAEIDAYWLQKVVALPENLWETAHNKIYDSKWENATATKKSWRDGIDNGIAAIVADIETIKSFHSEFEGDAFEYFAKSLSLQDGIRRMNELNAQKERFAEAERQRILREMQEKEFQAQLAREREEQMQKPAEPEKQEPVEEPVKAPEQPKASPDVLTQQKSEPAQTAVATPDPASEPEPIFVTLKITGTPHQINSIKGYIKYSGASYTEV